MHIKNIFAGACLALSATASTVHVKNITDIAPEVQLRLNSLDLGYVRTNNLLQNLAVGNPDVTPDFVLRIYNQTVATGAKDLSQTQPIAIPHSIQLILCQAHHNVAISGIQLNSAFVEYASHFNKTTRKELQQQFSTVQKEAKEFVRTVGEPALSYCVDSIRADNELVLATLNDAVSALDPSKAKK